MAQFTYPIKGEPLDEGSDLLNAWAESVADAMGRDSVQTGFTVASGGGLNLNVALGTAVVNGYRMRSDATIVKALTSGSVRHIWIHPDLGNRNTIIVTENAGSSPNANAIKIATVDTTGGSIGAITDVRPITLGFSIPTDGVQRTLWHSGNDGAGSGLDADLLDGLNSATGATASTIAARDGSAFLTAAGYKIASGNSVLDVSGNDTRILNTNSAGSLLFRNQANSATRGLMTDAGRWRFGTTDTGRSTLFQVASDSDAPFEWSTGDNSKVGRLTHSVNGIVIDTPTNTDLLFGANNTHYMTIFTTGVIGHFVDGRVDHELSRTTTGAAGQETGAYRFLGKSSTGATRTYAQIIQKIVSAANGSEYGKIVYEIMEAGVLGSRVIFDPEGDIRVHRDFVFDANMDGVDVGRITRAGTTARTWTMPDVTGTVFTTGNMGSGSGLDADLVDGKNPGSANGLATLDASSVLVQAAGFLKTGATPAANGEVSVTSGNLLYHDGTASRKVWSENNDGAGSGLDADLLDGLNSATGATASTIAARDGNGDITANKFRLPNSGEITRAGTTARVWTLPDAPGTVALLGISQTWLGIQIFEDNVQLDGSTLKIYEEDTVNENFSVGGTPVAETFTSITSLAYYVGATLKRNAVKVGDTDSGGPGLRALVVAN